MTLFSSLFAAQLSPRLLITIGGSCASIGLLLVSQAENTKTLLLGLVIAGISPGLCYPPLSDVIVQTYSKAKQGRVYAVMNIGTGVGVILAGPLALWFSDQWREAWMVLGILTVLITLWGWYVLTNNAHHSLADSPNVLPTLPLKWLLNSRNIRLYVFSLVLGLVSSIYWTFSIDIIFEASNDSGFLGLDHQFGLCLFWILLGISGCFGIIAGDLVHRLGIRTAIRLFTVLLSCSLWLLALEAANTILILVSAILFGSSFVTLTAFVGIWATYSFHQRPSTGFGFAFLVMSVGQFIGPFAAGNVAEYHGLSNTFIYGGFLIACLILLTPKTNIRQFTPDV